MMSVRKLSIVFCLFLAGITHIQGKIMTYSIEPLPYYSVVSICSHSFFQRVQEKIKLGTVVPSVERRVASSVKNGPVNHHMTTKTHLKKFQIKDLVITIIAETLMESLLFGAIQQIQMFDGNIVHVVRIFWNVEKYYRHL